MMQETEEEGSSEHINIMVFFKEWWGKKMHALYSVKFYT